MLNIIFDLELYSKSLAMPVSRRKEGNPMATKEYKQLSCRDFGADCDFMVRAQTEEEVISLATEHACRRHSKCEIPLDQSKITPFIKSVWV